MHLIFLVSSPFSLRRLVLLLEFFIFGLPLFETPSFSLEGCLILVSNSFLFDISRLKSLQVLYQGSILLLIGSVLLLNSVQLGVGNLNFLLHFNYFLLLTCDHVFILCNQFTVVIVLFWEHLVVGLILFDTGFDLFVVLRKEVMLLIEELLGLLELASVSLCIFEVFLNLHKFLLSIFIISGGLLLFFLWFCQLQR